MSDIWLVADTHFNHSNIIIYENRPFENKSIMNEVLIDNWNKTVKPNDTVYHLGDVVFGGTKILESIIPNLNGRKILRKGNHDYRTTNTKWKRLGFEEVYDDDILLDGSLCLSHYPLDDDTMKKLRHYDLISANVHGHVHSQIQDLDQSIYRCVSVELTDYRPIHLDEVKKSLGL